MQHPNVKVHFKHSCDKPRKKILFILKERQYYDHKCYASISYGLSNSCRHIAECLRHHHIESHIVTVLDNNDIDRVVSHYKPDICFIEALWVVPEKFPVLLALHPNVKFDVRLHSQIPFLSQEGMAFEWLYKYNELSKQNPNFSVSANNKRLIHELNDSLGFNILYTPNCYELPEKIKLDIEPIEDTLDIGCFSAIRILKNIPEQAISAINVANILNKSLNFHINHTIFEKAAEGIIINLFNMFEGTGKHKLVVHEWQNHEDFINLIKSMDIGMQVSMSETWNLVSNDFISVGVPIIGSKEIEFLSHQYQAEPTSFKDISNKLRFAISHKTLGTHINNEILLRDKIKESVDSWLEFLNNK